MLQQLDNTLFRILNRGAADGPLDWLMPRLTNLHQTGWFRVVVLLVCLGVLWKGSRQGRTWVLCVLVGVGLSDLASSHLIKSLWPRPRPCYAAVVGGPMAFPDTRLVPGQHCPGSSSFPSSHASNMMTVGAIGWWFTRRRARWLWFLLPLVIGYSRIYLGYHYPLDVLGGWMVGGLIALGVILLARRWLPSPAATDPLTEESIAAA